MRVVGIQEDGIVKFLTQTSHKSHELPRSRKLPFSPRSANDNRHVQFTSSFEDAFQQDEIGDVEVPNGDAISSRILNYFNEFLHWFFSRQVTCKPAAGGIDFDLAKEIPPGCPTITDQPRYRHMVWNSR